MSKCRPVVMASLRKSIPLVENGCRLVCLRGFHASPSIAARPAPRKSPRVAAAQPSASTVRVKKTYSSEESLPPISLINSARKSGALVIEPVKALGFLRQYQELAARPTPGWEQSLCTGELGVLRILNVYLISSQNSMSRHLPWLFLPESSDAALARDSRSWPKRSCCLHQLLETSQLHLRLYHPLSVTGF